LGSIFSDASEIIVEIQFGEGGDDSKMFVDELLSIYLKYAQSLKLKTELIHSRDGHKIIKILGKGAGRAFRYEGGKHCIQRIPPTETKGRKQTSMVCVAILPIKDDVCEPLKSNELETQTCGGHGPGGQHQNRTESAVRMRHKPTGITVFINGKDQHANRREALRVLTARVNDLRETENNAAYAAERRSQMGSGGRSDKIRTYNILEGRVVDHRLGTKTGNVKGVMKGRLDLILS
jgi:peptide chain release factor 1